MLCGAILVQNLQFIIDNFFDRYDRFTVEILKGGNINLSYHLLIYVDNQKQDYVLQKINGRVFENTKEVIENASLILDWIKSPYLEYKKTIDNKNYYVDQNGEYWRVYTFVKNSTSYDCSDNLYLIEQTGYAFGDFFKKLNDFDYKKLNITIVDFHNTTRRFSQLADSVFVNCERFTEIHEDYKQLMSLKKDSLILDELLAQKKLPIRTVHNDTKLSNVLFDKNSLKFITVIDLDTVMPGILAHDFGDGARSVCASHKEDYVDFKEVYFDLNKFYYFTKGFASNLKGILTEIEKKTLYLGVITITAELCARFMTDYLLNDIYFKIDYPTHNKVRYKNQLALLKDVYKKEKIIKEITYNLLY